MKLLLLVLVMALGRGVVNPAKLLALESGAHNARRRDVRAARKQTDRAFLLVCCEEETVVCNKLMLSHLLPASDVAASILAEQCPAWHCEQQGP